MTFLQLRLICFRKSGKYCVNVNVFILGVSSNAVQLNKLCAATLKYIFSSGTSMTITFHTDTSGASSGFSVKYKAGVYSTTPRGTDATCRLCEMYNVVYEIRYTNHSLR